MKILLGLPSFGNVHGEFMDSLVGMVAHTVRHRPDIAIFYHRDQRTYRHFARINIASAALTNETDYLLTIDDDMVFPPDALLRLLSHDKQIVTALYFQRGLPTSPVIYQTVKVEDVAGERMFKPVGTWKENELLKIGACGMGLCLIKTDVFRRIPEPWYGQEHGCGEDLFFCRRVGEAGIPIFCDTSIQAGHMYERPMIIGRDTWEKSKKGIISVEPELSDMRRAR